MLKKFSFNKSILGYGLHKGIHFVTMKGILEAPPESNCFGIVDVFVDKLILRGYGVQESKVLLFDLYKSNL